jgi:hypothetical protein
MTEQRYAHLSNDTIRNTADSIGNMFEQKPEKVVRLDKANDTTTD